MLILIPIYLQTLGGWHIDPVGIDPMLTYELTALTDEERNDQKLPSEALAKIVLPTGNVRYSSMTADGIQDKIDLACMP